MPDHPKPRLPEGPPIAEVMLEVEFTWRERPSWDPSYVGGFFTRIQAGYPTMEPRVEQGVELQRQGDTLVTRVLPPQPRTLFRSRAGDRVVQLMQGRVVLNVLPPYPGWAKVKGEMGEVWKTLKEVVPLTKASRLGLRYINKLARTGEGDVLGRWLHKSPYLSDSVLSARGEFSSNVRIAQTPSEEVQVTLARSPPGKDARYGTFVFDIHRAHRVLDEGTSILSAFDTLHEGVREIFDATQESPSQRLNTPRPP